jgi:dihydrodipicolinate synthase/N-acetylneuraminate lyase
MIVPPFYDAISWRELLAHYTAVADAIEVPIMYYNLPSASGVKLTAALSRESARLPRNTCYGGGSGHVALVATEQEMARRATIRR